MLLVQLFQQPVLICHESKSRFVILAFRKRPGSTWEPSVSHSFHCNQLPSSIFIFFQSRPRRDDHCLQLSWQQFQIDTPLIHSKLTLVFRQLNRIYWRWFRKTMVVFLGWNLPISFHWGWTWASLASDPLEWGFAQSRRSWYNWPYYFSRHLRFDLKLENSNRWCHHQSGEQCYFQLIHAGYHFRRYPRICRLRCSLSVSTRSQR